MQSEAPTILGIDPGPTHSAFCILSGDRILDAGIEPSEVVCNPDWLLEHKITWCNQVWIEMIACYGMPVGSEVFQTCLWIGRYIERCQQNVRLPTALVTRPNVKLHLCNSVRAKDSNVRQALIDQYGEPGRKSNPGQTYGFKADMWAALAVAHYGKHHAHAIEEQTEWTIAAWSITTSALRSAKGWSHTPNRG